MDFLAFLSEVLSGKHLQIVERTDVFFFCWESILGAFLTFSEHKLFSNFSKGALTLTDTNNSTEFMTMNNYDCHCSGFNIQSESVKSSKNVDTPL